MDNEEEMTYHRAYLAALAPITKWEKEERARIEREFDQSHTGLYCCVM